MSCSPFELKDYLLGELRAPERAAVEQHVSECAACRDELNALNLTRSALLSVPDEEPPRRIAFVSDGVFEPTWWQKLWRSGPQLGFASAAMLSAALLVHAFVPQNAPAPAIAPAPVAVTTSAIDIEKVVDAKVSQRLAEIEDAQTAKVLNVVNTRLRQADRQHREDFLLVKEYLERQQKVQARISRTAYDGVMR
jgi:anti-sigma factor RsiW